MDDYFLFICIIVVGGALLAWLANRFRQPILVGYFACGLILGPWGFGLIHSTELFENISRIGITLLLFLAGLVLHPSRLARFFKLAIFVTLGSSIITCLIVSLFLIIFGFGFTESVVAGMALMLSSTVLATKLLPTTTLHQKRMGGICIAILIAEDIIAVLLLMLLSLSPSENLFKFILILNAKAILMVVGVILFERYILRKMMTSASRYGELLLMLCLGWCLGIAALAEHLGLSYEIGAFIAGVVMARTKISYIFSESLKPLRDFFLLFFFFVLGAEFDVVNVPSVLLPAVLLGAIIITIRPLYLSLLLRAMKEKKEFSMEIGYRLGQASEFALIIAMAASSSGKLGTTATQLVQLVTILTMIASSYIIVFKYPTPISPNLTLKKD